MFEIAWSELLLIAVVAIVVIGPKDLPRAMRVVGQWTGRAKRMARDFQGQFNEALREADLEDVKKDVQALTKLDPLKDVRKELSDVDSTVRNLDKPKPAVPAALTQPVGAAPASPDSAPVAGAPVSDAAAQAAVEAKPAPRSEAEMASASSEAKP
jgi:sec-independent protein translocase protein TatB